MVYGKAIYQIVSFGKGYGKTKLVEKIVAKAKQESYKVAVVKHAHRGIDVKGKDSQRYIKAGADSVILVSERLQAIFVKKGYEQLENILASFNIKEHLILIEGFKNLKGYPKIVMVKNKEELLKAKEHFKNDCFLIVNTGKDRLSDLGYEVFTMENLDVIFRKIVAYAKEKIAKEDLLNINCGYCGYPTCVDFVEALLKGKKDILECPIVADVELRVNGMKVPLSPYPKLVIYETIKGLTKSLKGVPENIENLELRISYGKRGNDKRFSSKTVL